MKAIISLEPELMLLFLKIKKKILIKSLFLIITKKIIMLSSVENHLK